MRQLLGKYPGKTLHRLGVIIGTLWITGITINIIWQDSNIPIYNDFKELQKNNKNIL